MVEEEFKYQSGKIMADKKPVVKCCRHKIHMQSISMRLMAKPQRLKSGI